MRKIALTVVAGLVLPLSAQAAKYEFDSAHTYPNFTISHLGFSTMHGRFNKTSGSMELDMKKKTASFNVTIDAASIDTGFKKRDDHLRNQDFFNVVEFPEITFKSTKVKFMGDKKAEVTGKLTIMGVTKTVKLDVHSINCGTHPFNKKEVCGFDATTNIKRSDFGIKYGLPAIGDEVGIMLEAEAVRQ